MVKYVGVLGTLLLLLSTPAFAAEDEPTESITPAQRHGYDGHLELPGQHKDDWANTQEAFRAGVLKGKLESALSFNEHLDAFDIEVDMKGSTAVLSGSVSSEDRKALAGDIARGLEGIEAVDNRLVIDPDLTDDSSEPGAAQGHLERDFSQYVKDLSTTAAIKASLLAHEHVNGMSIKVDTYWDSVTLSGEAESQVQKDLAEYVAKKRKNISGVENRIVITGP